jgi:hypothetical protein
MDIDNLLLNFESSAAIKLIRSQNAPLVLSFLQHQFKRRHRVTIPHSELTERLGEYLEFMVESVPSLSSNAQHYLRTWCDEDHRFLRKYYDSNREDPVYELTPDTERALRWMEDLQKSEFVGTESRFLRIFDLLEEIVTYSTENVEIRLAQLEAEKQRIQDEIDQIRSTGKIEQYSQTQIKERFYEANDVARRLLSDFREVEENFRDIARQVQAKQHEAGTRRGTILSHVLDADALLKESDQGRSFYTFWEFLMSQSKQEHLRTLLESVYQLPDLQRTGEEAKRLRQLKRDLRSAGTKVVESNRRLSEQLRRLLDEQRMAEARRITELAGEIKQLALTLRGRTAGEKLFATVEAEPEVELPMERQLWEPSESTLFLKPEIPQNSEVQGFSPIIPLFDLFSVDQGRLTRHIATLLERQPEVTLAEVVEAHPIRNGLAEILAYCAIATREPHHLIHMDERESLLLDSEPSAVQIILPKIVFHREPVQR